MSHKMAPPSFSHADVKVLSREATYQGYFQVTHYKISHRLFRGGWSPPLTREIFERGDAAAVLPFDPVQNKVVLIEQFRTGALRHPRSPWLIELVAGIIEEGETPEQVAHREAQEEAGLVILDLMPIMTYFSSPGGSSEMVHLFCGKVDATHAKGIHGLVHEHEDIAVRTFDLMEAYEAMNAGVINNGFTIIALQWLKLNETLVKKHFR